MASFKLEKGGIYNNRCGSYKHDDIVGKKWGTKVIIIFFIPFDN